MDINLKNNLPPWNDKHLLIDEADAWKWKDEIAASKVMYGQWADVYSIVSIFADSLNDEGNADGSTSKLIYENLMMIAPKIMSATGDTLYIIKMENASIIRFNCRQMMEQIGWSVLNGEDDPKYKILIEESIEVFKQRFKEWVAFFKHDAIDDEWGLYK